MPVLSSALSSSGHLQTGPSHSTAADYTKSGALSPQRSSCSIVPAVPAISARCCSPCRTSVGSRSAHYWNANGDCASRRCLGSHSSPAPRSHWLTTFACLCANCTTTTDDDDSGSYSGQACDCCSRGRSYPWYLRSVKSEARRAQDSQGTCSN